MKQSKAVKTSMAASIIGCCSYDLLSLILIHLPAKTLLRFKLVSKQWKFVISDPQFAANHSRKNSDLSTPSGVFLYHPLRRTDDTISVPFLRNPTGRVPPLWSTFLDQLLPRDSADYYPRVFQSCKGLLLCVFFNNSSYRVNAKSVCVICNPTTRGFRLLPTPPNLGTNDEEWLDGLTLVFNPSESHHYKVVSIKRSLRGKMRLPGGSSNELCIYSSETKRWRFHRRSFINNPIGPNLQFRQGVFSNGSVFWMGWNRTYYYNVKSQNTGVIEGPVRVPVAAVHPPAVRYMNIDYFAESCGRLFYVSVIPPTTFYIYELDSVGMKWSKCRVEYLNRSDYSGCYAALHRTSVVAVSRRADDNWDFVFSLTNSFTNRLIIVNSLMGRHVQRYDVNNMSISPSYSLVNMFYL